MKLELVIQDDTLSQKSADSETKWPFIFYLLFYLCILSKLLHQSRLIIIIIEQFFINHNPHLKRENGPQCNFSMVMLMLGHIIFGRSSQTERTQYNPMHDRFLLRTFVRFPHFVKLQVVSQFCHVLWDTLYFFLQYLTGWPIKRWNGKMKMLVPSYDLKQV